MKHLTRIFPFVILLLISFTAVSVSMSLPNPPVTIPEGGCTDTAQLDAKPVSLNNTPLVRVDASCNVYSPPQVWKVEWLRYREDVLIQDVFQEPVEGPSILKDTYLYPNTANGNTRIEVRFWSWENECICAGNISLSSPVTPTPVPTTGSSYDYNKLIFGEFLDENGTVNQQVTLRADAGLYSYLIITLYNQSMVTNVTGTPQSYITYLAISVTGVIPGTTNTLYQIIPEGLELVSNGAWEIGPASWWFVPHAGIKIAYNELRIPPGNAETGIHMYRMDPLGGGWLLMTDTVVDTTFNTVTADVSEMGIYALFAIDTTTLNTVTTSSQNTTTESSTTTTVTISTTNNTTITTDTTTTLGSSAATLICPVMIFSLVVMMHLKSRRRHS